MHPIPSSLTIAMLPLSSTVALQPLAHTLSLPPSAHACKWLQGGIAAIEWNRLCNTPCRLSNSLKRGLEETEGNQCTIITWQMLNVWFPQICDRLQVPFYRTKVTSWMASMEEEYRFIIMEADASEDPNWAQLCVEQVWHATSG